MSEIYLGDTVWKEPLYYDWTPVPKFIYDQWEFAYCRTNNSVDDSLWMKLFKFNCCAVFENVEPTYKSIINCGWPFIAD